MKFGLRGSGVSWGGGEEGGRREEEGARRREGGGTVTGRFVFGRGVGGRCLVGGDRV